MIGPLSDRYGRRIPVIAAMLTYAVASLLCALATSVHMLIALRFIQGLAGAGGIVISRAVVRDLHTGARAVRLFSSLMLVTGLAPILAPLAGGQLLALELMEGHLPVALDPVGADRGARDAGPARDAAARTPHHERPAAYRADDGGRCSGTGRSWATRSRAG